MTDAMGVVGQRFQDNEIYVPEMLISARAMKAAVALLEPLLIGSGYKPDSVAVMGTIKGDLHDIGKNLVGMMLKGANFEIFDLGTNVSVDRFMAAAREHKADIIGISALLTTTMGGMRGVIEAVRAAGVGSAVEDASLVDDNTPSRISSVWCASETVEDSLIVCVRCPGRHYSHY